jgi:hypothetical protein
VTDIELVRLIDKMMDKSDGRRRADDKKMPAVLRMFGWPDKEY